ncbi:MAG: hypothetical protein ABIN89_23430 [Chitinophagaceae bacterium]
MIKILIAIPFFLCSCLTALPQNYHAIHGSSYAGSLGIANNPAAIINTPYSWDINLFSLQETTSTNAFTVLNYSLLSSAAKSQYRVDKGDFERYGKGNFNLHLFNARIALNRKTGIAFGMNVRGYLDAKTNKYNFIDTLRNFRNFLAINNSNTNLRGDMKSSNWLEFFGTYGRTLWDEEQSRLNGGITVKGTLGVAGGLVGIKGVSFTRTVQNNKPVYLVNAGSLRYGYSSTIDQWKKGRPSSKNIGDILMYAKGGVSLDLGMEYIIKPQYVTGYYGEDNHYDYEWKIAVSLLDLGTSKYEYSTQSREAGDPVINLSDMSLERKFNHISKIQDFNDSLGTVFTDLHPLTGSFTIINPARLVINVDRHLSSNFYLNGELSANLSSLAGENKLYSSELNFLTVTPRWETKIYGLYLPVQINAEHQFWVGGAIKAGPLLLGVHNLSNIFSKSKLQNGGGYLAIVLRSGSRTKAHRDSRYDCPK